MRTLFVASEYRHTRNWFIDTMDSISRGRNNSNVRAYEADTRIVFPDGSEFLFITINDGHDLNRYRGQRANAIIEHHTFRPQAVWFDIKPHLIDNRI